MEVTGPSARLKALRIAYGLSLREAAARAGIPASSWQTAEEGALPNATRAVVMARLLNTTVETIWGDSVLPEAPNAATVPA
jgi:transcriptional regulator with XRE-family HTH domain